MYWDKLQHIQDEVNRMIKGKEDVVKRVLAAMVGGGHILMEDLPGVGKTTLATAFAKVLSLDYRRMQFTPDVLPSDILGFSMYNPGEKEFTFHRGAVFCNLFLADEINRTSPKTQSALLEVMEEGQVSIEGETRRLEKPFIVIATQNPAGSAGTQLLPESQLDRFMVCLSMGYPAHSDAVELLKGEVWKKIEDLHPVAALEELLEMQAAAEKIFVHDDIYGYIVTLTEATRQNEWFASGAGPRGSIALLKMSRAMVLLQGRDFVTPQDVQEIAADVLGHRVKISSKGRGQGLHEREAIWRLLQQVKSPKS